MKTVEITGHHECRLIDKPIPSIRGNYVLIKVHVAPMCNEHVAYGQGVYLERNRPDSLGHEMAGEVIEVGANSSVKVGQRVVALCGFPCGKCRQCRMGYYSHCQKPHDPVKVCATPSGECSFAQYAVKPDWMLAPIPDALSYEHASMACCGLGPSFGAMARVNVNPFDTVMVTGLGPVGLGAIINAKYRGAHVIGVSSTPYRSNLARRLGCDILIDPNAHNPLEEIREATAEREVNVVLECSGQAHYQRLAIDAVGRLGSVVFLSEPGQIVLNVNNDLIQKGISLLGSLDINRLDADRLLQMIADVPSAIEAFITHRYPLAEIGTAFELQLKRECGKVLLYPWGVPTTEVQS